MKRLGLRRRFRDMRLGTKIFILMLSAVFLPLCIALPLFNNYTRETLNSRVSDAAANSFSQVYDVMSENYDLIRHGAQLMLLDANMRKLLQGSVSAGGLYTLKDQASSTVDYVERWGTWGIRMFIYVPDDYAIIDHFRYFPISDITSKSWYSPLTSRPSRALWVHGDNGGYPGGSIVSKSLHWHPESGSYSYLLRISKENQYTDTQTILRIDFSREALETTLHQSLTFDGSSAYLFTSGGEIVARASLGESVNDLPLNFSQMAISEAKRETREIDGKLYGVIYRSFKDVPWRLAMLVPAVNSFQTVFNSDGQWLILLFAAIACGFAVFVTVLMFSRGLISRIRMVSAGMSGIIGGKMEFLPETDNYDETGALVKSYNYLVGELEMLMTQKHLAGERQRRAELNALQAQINPHFLYNTLELINYFAYKGESKSVEHTVRTLAKFYKLCLNQGNEFCTLEQELELSQVFFSIQNMRYNGAIKIKIDVPEELYDYIMPRIILQPLVENAIRHGILNTPARGGTVGIKAYANGNQLIIAVSDDGVGISEERLSQIMEGVDIRFETAGETGSHYGIKNINERLQEYYGAECRLTFESSPGKGTTVYMPLPR